MIGTKDALTRLEVLANWWGLDEPPTLQWIDNKLADIHADDYDDERDYAANVAELMEMRELVMWS